MKNKNHIRTNSKRLIPKLLFLCFSLVLSSFALAQQVTVSFQPKNSTETIDSVQVTNLTKGQTVKLNATETIVFTPPTSVNHIELEGPDNGYLYPNPFNDYTTLAFNTTKSRKVSIAIYTVSGQTIYSQTQSLSPGSHRFQLQFPASGFYNIVVLGDKKPLSYKAVYTGRNQQKVDIQYLGGEELQDVSHKSNQLKSVRNEKSLDYSNGDVVHYIVYSGENTTIIADAPTTSKTIEVEFYECKDPDGRNYKIVQIGDQWWMAENLAYLPSVSPPDQSSEADPYYYVNGYDGDDLSEAKATENFTVYGVLYNWPAAANGEGASFSNPSDVRGACPEGWHLPSDKEWNQLEDYLISNGYNFDATTTGNKIAKSMAATILWKASSNIGAVGNNLLTNNSSGFSALSGGFLNYSGGFASSSCYWWSSNTGVWGFRNSDSELIGGCCYRTDYGMSVRCVRNSEQSMVETSNASEVTQIAAMLHGKVTYDGGSAITDRGFYWSANNEEPGENDNVETAGDGLGEFSATLSDLQPNRTYYYRAFATNAHGTSTGSVMSFTTRVEKNIETGTLIDPRDGKNYETVKIGNQWWMAENLAYLPEVSPSSEGSGIESHYYVYDYNGTDVSAAKATENFTTYGVLYNWPSAKEACPNGWHLPSDDEWTQLENYLADNGYNYDGTIGGGGDKIAKSIAANKLWRTSSDKGAVGNNLSVNNSSGFSGLPGGTRGSNFVFYNVGSTGNWWSSSELDSANAFTGGLSYDVAHITGGYYGKLNGFNVRCIMDSEQSTSNPSVETGNATDITQAAATLNGNVTSDGGAEITARGFYWSTTNEEPEENDNVETAGDGLGEFSVTLSDLQPNTSYYYRAFASNAEGTSTGSVMSFKTSEEQDIETGTLTDSRDDKTYKTVKIGDQWWMAENLAYLPSVGPSSQGSETAPYYYVYDFEGTDISAAKTTENYKIYGVLYNWPAAMAGASSSDSNPSGVQGACPEGWHLPSDNEWEQLAQYISDQKGPFSKSDDDWNDVGEYLTANHFGFSALSGGFFYDANFYGFDRIGRWWSATETSNSSSWSRGVGYIYTDFEKYYYLGPAFYRHENNKGYGSYLRCIKDSELTTSIPSVETGNASSINQTTATLNGNVTSDGGAEITARGFYWSTTNEEPGENDNVETAGDGLGEFSVTLSDLQPNTTYYFRTYASNSQGTSIGSVISFTTSEEGGGFDGETGTFTDARDDNTYKWVKIGDQVWMAENLAYLPSVSPSLQGSETASYYYVYDYEGTDISAAKATENYKIYGVLYNWPAAMAESLSSDSNPSGVQGAARRGGTFPAIRSGHN